MLGRSTRLSFSARPRLGASLGLRAGLGFLLFASACQQQPPQYETLPPAVAGEISQVPGYAIGSEDMINVFVWQNEELSVVVPVRPDGMISMPLVGDMQAVGKTPSQLAIDIERNLEPYIIEPQVTVGVEPSGGLFSPRVQVIGEAVEPMAVPYQVNMTILDVVVEVGGLTEFADGNRTRLIRVVDEEYKQFRVRLEDLIDDGDMSANVKVLPGDIVIVPEGFF